MNSEDRVAVSQTVRTEMLWQVCVPVGSSSRATRMGTLESGDLRRVRVLWRRSRGEFGGDGRDERVAWRLRGEGVAIPIVVDNVRMRSAVGD